MCKARTTPPNTYGGFPVGRSCRLWHRWLRLHGLLGGFLCSAALAAGAASDLSLRVSHGRASYIRKLFPQRFGRSSPFPRHLVGIAQAPPPFPRRSAAAGRIGPLNPGKPYQVVGFSALAAGRGICS